MNLLDVLEEIIDIYLVAFRRLKLIINKRNRKIKNLLEQETNKIEPKIPTPTYLRTQIEKTYKTKKIIGVFSKYEQFKSKTSNATGKELIDKISRSLCHELNCVCLTGRGIYYKKRAEVKVDNWDFYKLMKLKDKKKSEMKTCEFLGQIPENGIFLLDGAGSGCFYEAQGFNKKTRNYGLAVVIASNIDNVHENYKEIVIKCKGKRHSYFECKSKEYDECLKTDAECLCAKNNISKTISQMFIDKKRKLIFIDDSLNLDNILTCIIKDLGIMQ